MFKKKSMNCFLIFCFLFILVIFVSAIGYAETYKWKMTTSWPTGIQLYEDMAVRLAERVEEMSNGRLKIQVFPGGTITPSLEVYESVEQGIVEMGHSWPGYDLGRDPTSCLIGGYAGGVDSEQILHWIYKGGGYELWQKWRKDKFGLIAFPGGMRPAEIFLWSHKKVKTLEDLKGLKIRTVGAWAEIAPGLGASVVSLPGGEVIQALERKVIDATEWATPGENLRMGFHDVADYCIVPGVHQPSAPFEFVINQKAWNDLPEDLQKIVENAAKAVMLTSWLDLGMDSVEAIKTYKKRGKKIVELDKEVVMKAKKLGLEWAKDKIKENPDNEWFKKIFNSQREFESKWQDVVPFRTLDYYSNK